MTERPTPYYADDLVTLYHGDCLDVLRQLPAASVDSVVTDPPYGLEFMGKEWDGADGFRRSLNPADAGRDNAFGRTSRTSPEYRTASKATATRRQEGGISQATGPSFLGGLNPKCLACDKWQRGSNPCRCESPEWTQERLIRLHTFQEWCEAWSRECLRVLRPGGHMLAFGGSRTWHRLAAAVEDAGFEIRDSLAWLYGSGFPKSLDVSKAIDKAVGATGTYGAPKSAVHAGWLDRGRMRGEEGNEGWQRPWMQDENALSNAARKYEPGSDDAERWQGWGTALKPAFEPVVVARKPLAGTVAANVLTHGTGALNIDACRIESTEDTRRSAAGGDNGLNGEATFRIRERRAEDQPERTGRWPANVILDESQAAELDQHQSGESTSRVGKPRGAASGDGWGMTATGAEYDDLGGASRFFYVAKAASAERVRVDGVAHPTVKPLDVMRWLVRLVTPPGGTVLDMFAGSGTTGEACILEGVPCILIEREADYLPLIRQRIDRRHNPVAAVKTSGEDGGLFDLLDEETA